MVETSVTIRAEAAGDEEGIRRVNAGAFGRPGEGALVDALRAAGQAPVSLVAERDGEIVGHIMFSPVEVRQKGREAWPAIALGPMAVLPERQGQGIGTALVREGLARCQALGEEVIFVLGHPAFYSRFGFVPAGGSGIDSQYGGGEPFMLVTLAKGALGGRQGRVTYHHTFNEVT